MKIHEKLRIMTLRKIIRWKQFSSILNLKFSIKFKKFKKFKNKKKYLNMS